MQKRIFIAFAILSVVTIIAYALILNPTIQEKVGWQFNAWLIRARTWVNPPEQVAFSAGTDTTPAPDTLPSPNVDSEIEGAPAQNGTAEPIPTFAPLPDVFSLEPGQYFTQHYRLNYCGPASMAMLLSYWGWDGTHDQAASVLKPNKVDKNVMPYEMADFVSQAMPGMDTIIRVGGDFETLKRLIANGYPVLIEKGPQFRDINYHITWMGHYQVLTGYNDQEGYFIAQDSYEHENFIQSYNELLPQWRSFNYLYLVAFPSEDRNDVLNLLGEDADEELNYRNALQKAQNEIYQVDGVDRFFALYNYGTNLVSLRDYEGAAKAYDQAFAVYDALPEDITVRPYRMLWYQTGPYYAYYYTGRYVNVIKLATDNSIKMVRDDEPALEESFYWRGAAKIALGIRETAIEDFQTCLEYHPGFQPCVDALQEQGIFQE
jgi:uncharacterized protein YvpB